MDAAKTESSLRGSTLRVYWTLFEAGRPRGVREIQRALGFASPSTALYHLEKLRDLGVVGKDQSGQYVLVEDVKVGTMQLFLRVGRIVLPRFLFYAAFFTVGLLAYLLLAYQSRTLSLMALAFGTAGAVVCWYEVVRLWRERLI